MRIRWHLWRLGMISFTPDQGRIGQPTSAKQCSLLKKPSIMHHAQSVVRNESSHAHRLYSARLQVACFELFMLPWSPMVAVAALISKQRYAVPTYLPYFLRSSILKGTYNTADSTSATSKPMSPVFSAMGPTNHVWLIPGITSPKQRTAAPIAA